MYLYLQLTEYSTFTHAFVGRGLKVAHQFVIANVTPIPKE